MDTQERVEIFKNTKLGRVIGVEEVRRKLDEIQDKSFLEPCILEFSRGRIFSPDEFVNDSESSYNLKWRDISAFSLYSGDNGVLYRNLGKGYGNGFDDFFASLLDRLVLDGAMRKDEFLTPSHGDYLVDGRGIYVKRYPLEGDSMGNPMVNAYYPRIEEDAIEYARAFHSGFATISKTIEHITCQ